MSWRLQHALEITFVDRIKCFGLWVCFDALASGCFSRYRHRSTGGISVSLPPLSVSLLWAGGLCGSQFLLVARPPGIYNAAPPVSPRLAVIAALFNVAARREEMTIFPPALDGLGICFSIARLE